MLKFPRALLAVALFLTGCTSQCGGNRGNLSPEQVVEGYLDVALNMTEVSQRDKLLDYTTGNLKAAIEAATPETIKTAYVDRKYKIISYSVVERRDRTPRETEITFQLTYNDLGPEGKDPANAPKVTTENTVSVVREKGAWLIKDVLGNKTAIDFPVSEESKITAKPGPGIDEVVPAVPAPEAAPAPAPAPAPEGQDTQGG
jgi:hypothetical protein